MNKGAENFAIRDAEEVARNLLGKFSIRSNETAPPATAINSILEWLSTSEESKDLTPPQQTDYTSTEMQPVSKDLLDARLETIEARMDARVAGMSSKLDVALSELRADRELQNARFARMESDGRDAKATLEILSRKIDHSVTELSRSVDERLATSGIAVGQQVQSLKSNIWFGVATTIASVLAVLALTYASFDSGRETSKSISEATIRMEKLQAQLEAQTKAAVAPAPQQ